jgi:hypothetical protein
MISNKYLIILLLIAAVLISAHIILSQEGRVPDWPADQSFVKNVDIHIGKKDDVWFFHYPKLQDSGGITASLVIGLYKLLISVKTDSLNYHAKIFSMLLFFISGFFMANQYLRTNTGLFIFCVIMATSGFQFVEPSSELIAAAYLSLFFYGISREWNPIILNLLLVCFGFSKVELTIVAVSLALYWIWNVSLMKKRKTIFVSFIMWVSLFLAPDLFLYGTDAILGDRAFNAFGDKYGVLFNNHQFMKSIEPSMNWKDVMNISFPSAKSFFDVVTLYPRKYLDYVALSVLNGIIAVILTFKGMPFALTCRQQIQQKSDQAAYLQPMFFISFAISLIPMTLISFPCTRYFARYFLPFAVLSISQWESCSTEPMKKMKTCKKNIILAALIITVIWQLMEIICKLSNSCAV